MLASRRTQPLAWTLSLLAAFLAGAALSGGLPPGRGGGGGGGALGAGAARLLIEEGGAGLSTGTKVAYIIVSIILVAVSGLMAGLVLGLLSLDKVDLEVAKRTGSDKQRWLVERVEPFTDDPHWVMCSLVVVNAACNTALPLFIDRLLNPLAAILISVTAVLLFAEITPQAVCKRYGLEIGAYCSWLVRALMLLTAPVSWPLGKLLDWLLGEESALFRRQELKALVGMHAEPQQDGSVGALTTDEVQVIQGALDLASKTAEAVMTPLSKVFMLSSDATISKELLAEVIAAGHSRMPVYEGTNKQAILGLILVKELVLVDETAGVRVRDLRLREMPFLRADIPLYDVMKIFRFGRRHMACLTRVSGDPSARKGSHLSVSSLFRRQSPALATLGDKQVEEVVGIITIEDVLEELLQAEIVDETDRFEDNEQTVTAAPQMSLKELPPHLRRFLSPRRSMAGFGKESSFSHRRGSGELYRSASNASAASAPGAAIELQPGASGSSAGGSGAVSIAGGAVAAAAAPPALHVVPSASSAAPSTASSPQQQPRSRAPSPSLGAAAAANALKVATGPQGGDPNAMAAALAAGVRAAELQYLSTSPPTNGGAAGGALPSPNRPPRPPAPAALHQRAPSEGHQRAPSEGATAEPVGMVAAERLPPRTGRLGGGGGSGGGAGDLGAQPASSAAAEHVSLEMGEWGCGTAATSDSEGGGSAGEQQQLVRPGSRAS